MKLKKYVLLILFSISNAYATVETGNSFLEKLQSGKPGARTYLSGYVAGLFDAYDRIEPSFAQCIGSDVRMSQIIDTLEIYLKSNPQLRHYAMFEIYSVAIKQAFNCK